MNRISVARPKLLSRHIFSGLTMFLKRRFARKGVLLASASILAVMLATGEAGASDLPTTKGPAIFKEPPPADQWTVSIMGGYSLAPGSDPAIGPIPFGGLAPGPGWITGALIDYAPASLTPYHFSADFRYGQNSRGGTAFSRGPFGINLVQPTPTAFTGPAVVNATGASSLLEDHWLADFAVGRDFALGSGHVQAKVGVRVAEITSTLTGNGSLAGCFATAVITPACATPVTGKLAFQSRSRFLGVGPRVGVDGSQPIAGQWTFDYMGGAAVLFGRRSLSASELLSGINATTFFGTKHPEKNISASLYAADNAAVFNLDAQAGISYWINPNFKITGAYLFDGYFNALKVLDANGNIVNQNRFYNGPILSATMHF